MKEKLKIAVCPGSFDPITNGHLDIIRRAAGMFDEVIVLVLHNPEKTARFTTQERVDMAKRSVAEIENVSVDTFGGLLADYCKLKKVAAIVKGLRAVSDFEYEFQMGLMNKKLNPEMETVFLITAQDNMFLSSSIVKQLANFGGDISDFIPAPILRDVENRLKGKN